MANVSYLHTTHADETGEAPAFMSQSNSESSMMNFRQVFSVIWRRKWIVVAIMALVIALTYFWLQSQTPLYSAGSEVVIGIREDTVTGIEGVVQREQQDFYFNETQAKIISSSQIAEEVATRLDLFENPEQLYWKSSAGPSAGQQIKSTIKSILPEPVVEGFRSVLNLLRGGSQTAEDRSVIKSMTPEERAAFERQTLIRTLLDAISVDPSDRSRTIAIRAISDKPDMARKIANTFAEAYVDSTQTEKSDATTRASGFLRDEVERLLLQSQQSEQALAQFSRDTGFVSVGDRLTLIEEQLADLNSKLVLAREELAESQARNQQVRRLLSEEGGIETVASVLESPLISRLREQEAEVVREIAELRTQLRDRHPRLLLKRAELEDLQLKIRSEIDKIVIGLNNKLELAQVKVRNLENEVAVVQAQIAKQSDAEVTLQSLQSQRDADKQLYETVLTRFNEINLQERAPQKADARIISRAATPLEPSFPRKSLTMAAAIVGSAMLAIMVVFLIEYMDSGFRSLHQLQQQAYVPALGIIPRLSVLEGRRYTPEDFVLDEPNSLYSESIRTIRTSLMLSSIDSPPRSVMFTSSVPAEGKTSTAVSVARAAAKAGQRTILVDCDLRKPSVNESLRVPNGKGVVEILTGNIELDDAIEIDLKSGLHYITAGAKAPNPPDALGSVAMRQLITELEGRYDLVILDTPPVLPVSDSLVLLRHVDKAVFLVRWGSTRREAVLAGIRQVQEANGDLAGVAMTRVDIRKHQKYNYSDSYYYYRGYGKYYGT
ncbi:GumC family protein [Minwuia sp.]|uniref:GumC family protein n=1 Tax=Minwuia sp. TaxID=2493630 RepID=UPI003A9465A2